MRRTSACGPVATRRGGGSCCWARAISRGLCRWCWTTPAMLAARLEVLAALGHGRSYGLESRVLGRSLPGILQSGLWPALAARQSNEVAALVTDVGNDIVYGARAAVILEWIAECLTRLAAARARTVITLLPLAGISALPPWRYRLLRTLLFPGCRLSFADCARPRLGLARWIDRSRGAFGPPRPSTRALRGTVSIRFISRAACGPRLGAKSFRAGKTRRPAQRGLFTRSGTRSIFFRCGPSSSGCSAFVGASRSHAERSATARRSRCIELCASQLHISPVSAKACSFQSLLAPQFTLARSVSEDAGRWSRNASSLTLRASVLRLRRKKRSFETRRIEDAPKLIRAD